MKATKLRAYANVIDLAEERRLRDERAGEYVIFVGFREREPENAPPAAPERRQRLKWLRTVLGLAKRARPS